MLSEEQTKFVNAVKTKQNVTAVATAGAGKTFTLTQAAKSIPDKTGVAVTFSKQLADEMSEKLPENIKGKTIHSLCYGTIGTILKKSGNKGKLNVENNKYRKLFRAYDLYGDNVTAWLEEIETIQKQSFKTPTELKTYINLRYTEAATMLLDIFQDGLMQFYDNGVVTFNDMVWYTMLLDGKKYSWKNGVIMLDEAQDVSELYLNAIKAHAYDNSQWVVVGDPQQTIHGWNGIPLDRFKAITDDLQTHNIRFNRSYRLPLAVVELLHNLCLTDDIITNNQNQGSVNHIEKDVMATIVKPGDMILSRYHAAKGAHSLVEIGLSLLHNDIPVRYVRFDPVRFVENFVNYCKQSHKGKSVIAVFPLWEQHMYKVGMSTLPKNATTQEVIDREDLIAGKVNSVQLHLNLYKAESPDGFNTFVQGLYTRHNTNNAVLLSSCHAAKGLESNNVFIVNPQQLMQMRKDATEEDYISEANVTFVAYTRTKENLYFVGGTSVMSLLPTYLDFYRQTV